MSTGAAGSTSTATTTGGEGLVVAGELIVDLDVADIGAGDTTWPNPGTAADFDRVGDPTVADVGGYSAAVFDGNGDAWLCQSQSPASICGLDPTRSIEVWAFNASIGGEESLVAWGERGEPAGRTVSINYGNDSEHGAVTQWTDPLDLGWNPVPAAGQWHYLVYTYDGTTTRVYADGMPNNQEVLGAGAIDTECDEGVVLGAQHESNGTLGQFLDGAIARVRVHSGVLSDMDVAANYAFEGPDFGQ